MFAMFIVFAILVLYAVVMYELILFIKQKKKESETEESCMLEFKNMICGFVKDKNPVDLLVSLLPASEEKGE